jgi:hypothetical protein
MKFSAITLLLTASVLGASSSSTQIGQDDKPDSCVSLYVHEDQRCKDEAVKVISFPTWSAPGSHCYTNDNLIVSVKDQYCNAETGNWHQTVYPKGDCGEVPWWLSWAFPQDQTFAPDNCILGLGAQGAVGLRLKSCNSGPCEKEGLDLEDESFLFTISRNLRA